MAQTLSAENRKSRPCSNTAYSPAPESRKTCPGSASFDHNEPTPLRIEVQHGDAPIERVAQDILGLTKLNYNACHLGDGQPVTVGFSDAVGEILISNPTVEYRRPNFKYYI